VKEDKMRRVSENLYTPKMDMDLQILSDYIYIEVLGKNSVTL
jgi:hypothetical protein